MRKFVAGDIHGEYDALMKCLELVKFDYENDKLILLGDLCDRGKDSWRVVQELLKMKHVVSVRGNHDEWFSDYLTNQRMTKDLELWWLPQGGLETILSYEENGWINIDAHTRFYKGQLRYHTEDNRLFVHAGLDIGVPMGRQSDHFLYWDREFVKKIFGQPQQRVESFSTYEGFSEVYIGHTPVVYMQPGIMTPLNRLGVWLMDTGSGKGGRLTLMNVDTKEYVQSK